MLDSGDPRPVHVPHRDTGELVLVTPEEAQRALLEQGVAVAIHLRRHHNLIAWAKERGPFVRVDRAMP